MRRTWPRPLCRVQDRDGRGPFAPGVPVLWADDGAVRPPAVHDLFGVGWKAEVPPGWHVGVGVFGLEGLRVWFSGAEMDRLAGLGFRPALVGGFVRVLRESPDQVLFARRLPLAWRMTWIGWEDVRR